MGWSTEEEKRQDEEKRQKRGKKVADHEKRLKALEAGAGRPSGSASRAAHGGAAVSAQAGQAAIRARSQRSPRASAA